MKFAIISDIHGNLPALDAVIQDAEKSGVDSFIFAGDYCISNPYPDECISRIRAIANKYVVRGNEEKYLEKLVGQDTATWTDGQMQVTYWAYQNISADNLQYLLSQPAQIQLTYQNRVLYLTHASSDFIGDGEYKNWGTGQVARRYGDGFISRDTLQEDICKDLSQDNQFQGILRTLPEGIYIFGHTHVQWSYQTEDGRHIFINPGSCGLPLDCIREGVPYTILELADSGAVNVRERRVPFDLEKYVQSFKQSDQYKKANVWSKVNVKELEKRREHMTFFLQFVEEYAQKIGDSQRPFSVPTWEQAFAQWEKTDGA
ncbi:MAG: metallophosphatase family protein [Acetatifactor sp.]|nr:metallophosphatase family protein [Acetatifactor sp.]